MARIHFFELEDQKWFPESWRNYGTDYLQFITNKAKLFKSAVPVFENALNRLGTTEVIDLGSGGGGSWIWINGELKKSIPELTVTLTDFYPNIPAFKRTNSIANNIGFKSESVDARNVPFQIEGLRTQFLSFHHFKPAGASKILQNAIDSQKGIAVFEATERSFPSILSTILSPIVVLLMTPFIRPFKWGRLFFTYLIPVIPFLIMFDGIVSCLRTYSVTEMENLVQQLDNHDTFDWEIKRLKDGPATVLYLVGIPK